MPIYEYRCKKCGKRFERIQKFSDPPLETCEKCGGTLERLLSSPAIQFKGSGWYVTDYGRKSPPASETASKSQKPSDAGSKTSPSETGKSEGASKKKD